jgi:hypothetical protein
MIPHYLDDGSNTTVAYAESFAGRATHISLAAGRAVEGDVADDDVLFGDKRGLVRWLDDQLVAG